MRCEPPDCRTYQALRSLNVGFLALVSGHDAPSIAPRLGLDPLLGEQLRCLAPDELEFIAGTPSLLAGFDAREAANNAQVRHVAESSDRRLVRSADRSEQRPQAEYVFAAALLTYLWQLDRRDRLLRVLCIGSTGLVPEMTIRHIQIHVAEATLRLRARFADHPRFWPDLIRAARSHDPELRRLSRLTAIPLALAEGCAAR